MSVCAVYQITPDGDVVAYEEVPNGRNGPSLIWETLVQAHTGKPCGPERAAARVTEWFGTEQFLLWENVAAGFLFDGAWVRTDRIPTLVDALDLYLFHHCAPPEDLRSPTVPLRELIEKLCTLALESPAVRGVCFNLSSVVPNPWRVKDPRAGGKRRPFNFDCDTTLAGGVTPWELFTRLGDPPTRA